MFYKFKKLIFISIFKNNLNNRKRKEKFISVSNLQFTLKMFFRTVPFQLIHDLEIIRFFISSQILNIAF